ncbi:hypothetical protein, partial [Paraglaciecola sp.]|uniref:hypothetical protein n=1 Tax=Paraglaciecola sp. TaxID=1920173 RepID=UPI00273EA6DF
LASQPNFYTLSLVSWTFYRKSFAKNNKIKQRGGNIKVRGHVFIDRSLLTLGERTLAFLSDWQG